jgi:NADH:ubiquinone oxidoreductase subunit 2 (subunit N)
MPSSAIKYINWRIQIVAKIVLFFRVILSFRVQRFIAMWVLLELNFLAFIFILSKSFVVKASNKTLNYFLVQAIGRGLVLIVIFIFFMRVSHTLLIVIYFLALLIKLGGVPFHNWYLKLVQKLSWEIIWVLSVWQKLIPLLILSKPSFNLTLLASVLRVALSSISRISQKNIKKILGLSSIFSLGWILVSFELRKTIWLQFILGYGARLAILLGRLILRNQGVSQNFNKDLGSSHLVIFFLGFLMLRGIPPFIGFFLKILILFNLTHLRLILVLLFLVFSVILIFVYLNITFLLFTFVVNKFSFSRLIDHSSYFFLDLVILNLFLRILLLINFCN